VQPRVAVVSVGAGNPYGHPAPATIARLRAAGATVYRTDLDGSVEISTDGRDLQVRPTGARPRATPSATGLVAPVAPVPSWLAAWLATIGPWPSPPVNRPWPSSSTSTPPPGS